MPLVLLAAHPPSSLEKLLSRFERGCSVTYEQWAASASAGKK